MINLPHRKNNPEALRAKLLDAAAGVIIEHGLPALTLESVARQAGVSKGGLLHHYPGKDALVDGLFEQVVNWFGGLVEATLDPDETSHGRFSRAYLQVIAGIDMSLPEEKRLAVLILMLSSDPRYCGLWNNWVEARLDEHRQTDSTPLARTLRLAADGLWLSDLGGGPDSNPATRREILKFLEDLDAAPALSVSGSQTEPHSGER
ncbi:transcriptional regulator, TetR family [Hoeflea sp. IMCC20628]|uniref:TetR/AcrR family transcriptional regulator n=1 Tax=Hoeflea sp. IMCC20628 TaxID=1620421 RepID=UPI00063AA92C|nr:TetR/AcrR family transcriptional regulator [Hoeflea sp. IMCC20628]AKI02733.1 transcriptional regulator, TetR family [Hoeflea sp. IMCC20628]